MVLLFVSYVCDYCEGTSFSHWYSGFIVFQPERLGGGNPFHVFRSRTDAAIWRSASGLQQCELREVLSENPIAWKSSRGTISNIQLADRPFEIFADHRFEPGENRAFIAPLAAAEAA